MGDLKLFRSIHKRINYRTNITPLALSIIGGYTEQHCHQSALISLCFHKKKKKIKNLRLVCCYNSLLCKQVC